MEKEIFNTVCDIINCDPDQNIECNYVGKLIHAPGFKMEITNIDSFDDVLLNQWKTNIQKKTMSKAFMKYDLNMSKITIVIETTTIQKKCLKKSSIYLVGIFLIYIRLCLINYSRYGVF